MSGSLLVEEAPSSDMLGDEDKEELLRRCWRFHKSLSSSTTLLHSVNDSERQCPGHFVATTIPDVRVLALSSAMQLPIGTQVYVMDEQILSRDGECFLNHGSLMWAYHYVLLVVSLHSGWWEAWAKAKSDVIQK